MNKNILEETILKENEYSKTIETTNSSKEKGKFIIEDKKYLIYKGRKNNNFNEIAESYKDKYTNCEISFGIDIKTGEHSFKEISKITHTGIFGITNSGKTVTIKWLMYQIALCKYSEFMIIGKEDLIKFKDLKKVKHTEEIKDINKSKFINFLNKIWLNVADREVKLKELGYNGKYEEYKKNVMMKDPSAFKISNIFVIIDEFETIREKVSNELVGGSIEFDRKIKTLTNYARAYGINFIFGSQNYIKEEIGTMRDYTSNQLIGFSKNVQVQYINTEISNIKQALAGTYLFYDVNKNTYNEIPFSSTIDENIIDACNNNLSNIEYKKNIDLFELDSDIFNNIDKIYNYFELNEYLDKKDLFEDFIPFSILLYIIVVILKNPLYFNSTQRGKEIYDTIYIEKFKDFDKNLYFNNKYFYQTGTTGTFIKEIEKTLQRDIIDEKELLEKLIPILKNYLDIIILKDNNEIFKDM